MKFNNKKIGSMLTLIGIILILIIGLIFLAGALTSEEQAPLQNELNSLSDDLVNSGYSWLANYSSDEVLNSGRIGVYEVNGTIKIAEFTGILDFSSGGAYYKIYLTNLTEECYDNETEILTENGWKYFNELENEKVATLNNITGNLEWQKPTAKQSYGHNGEMYNIVLEDGGGLLVSPEHKVYSASKNFESSSVVNTLISHCSLKCKSFDQIGISNSNANAMNGESVLCEINFSALHNKNCEDVLNSIKLERDLISEKNFSLDILDLEQIKSQYLPNSSVNSLGANNSSLYFFNNLLVNESDLNKENTMLVSTTNFILNYLYFFQMSSLNFLPSSMQSSSVSSDFSKSLSSFSSNSSCFILFANASRANSLQLSQVNLSIFCLNLSGIDKVMFAILFSDKFSCNPHNTSGLCVFKPFGLDYTLFAKRAENSSVIINGTEVPSEIYEKKKRIDEIRRMLNETE